ncbi:MAG: hypothetical protein P4K98_13720, partial [Bryobacteraceae bacterium]|nr:hypothetical protein [Bryobacteraceae bacterium]
AFVWCSDRVIQFFSKPLPDGRGSDPSRDRQEAVSKRTESRGQSTRQKPPAASGAPFKLLAQCVMQNDD